MEKGYQRKTSCWSAKEIHVVSLRKQLHQAPSSLVRSVSPFAPRINVHESQLPAHVRSKSPLPKPDQYVSTDIQDSMKIGTLAKYQREDGGDKMNCGRRPKPVETPFFLNQFAVPADRAQADAFREQELGKRCLKKSVADQIIRRDASYRKSSDRIAAEHIGEQIVAEQVADTVSSNKVTRRRSVQRPQDPRDHHFLLGNDTHATGLISTPIFVTQNVGRSSNIGPAICVLPSSAERHVDPQGNTIKQANPITPIVSSTRGRNHIADQQRHVGVPAYMGGTVSSDSQRRDGKKVGITPDTIGSAVLGTTDRDNERAAGKYCAAGPPVFVPRDLTPRARREKSCGTRRTSDHDIFLGGMAQGVEIVGKTECRMHNSPERVRTSRLEMLVEDSPVVNTRAPLVVEVKYSSTPAVVERSPSRRHIVHEATTETIGSILGGGGTTPRMGGRARSPYSQRSPSRGMVPGAMDE